MFCFRFARTVEGMLIWNALAAIVLIIVDNSASKKIGTHTKRNAESYQRTRNKKALRQFPILPSLQLKNEREKKVLLFLNHCTKLFYFM